MPAAIRRAATSGLGGEIAALLAGRNVVTAERISRTFPERDWHRLPDHGRSIGFNFQDEHGASFTLVNKGGDWERLAEAESEKRIGYRNYDKIVCDQHDLPGGNGLAESQSEFDMAKRLQEAAQLVYGRPTYAPIPVQVGEAVLEEAEIAGLLARLGAALNFSVEFYRQWLFPVATYAYYLQGTDARVWDLLVMTIGVNDPLEFFGIKNNEYPGGAGALNKQIIDLAYGHYYSIFGLPYQSFSLEEMAAKRAELKIETWAGVNSEGKGDYIQCEPGIAIRNKYAALVNWVQFTSGAMPKSFTAFIEHLAEVLGLGNGCGLVFDEERKKNLAAATIHDNVTLFGALTDFGGVVELSEKDDASSQFGRLTQTVHYMIQALSGEFDQPMNCLSPQTLAIRRELARLVRNIFHQKYVENFVLAAGELKGVGAQAAEAKARECLRWFTLDTLYMLYEPSRLFRELQSE